MTDGARTPGRTPSASHPIRREVASGIVSSLARPGGYITGMQTFSPELQGKRLQILEEIVPTLSRIAVLRRGTWPPGAIAAYRQATDDAAKKLGLRPRYVLFRNPDELPTVFAGMVTERDAAILIWSDPAISQHKAQCRKHDGPSSQCRT